MLSKEISLRKFFVFLAFILLVLASPSVVAAQGETEIDIPPLGEGDIPGGGGVDLFGVEGIKMSSDGLMSQAPDLMNLWSCSAIEDGVVTTETWVDDQDSLMLGTDICGCNGILTGEDCELDPCDYSTIAEAADNCFMGEGQSCVEDGFNARLVSTTVTYTVPIFTVDLDICYRVDPSITSGANLVVRVSDAISGVFGGGYLVLDDEKFVQATDGDATGTCPAGYSGVTYTLPPQVTGSYNVQVSISESDCGPLAGVDDSVALRGGETENWVFRVGMTGPNCDVPDLWNQLYDRDNPIPGPPDLVCASIVGYQGL